MFKQVVLSQIEIPEGNAVQVRFAKQIVDGDAVLLNEYHRTLFPVGTDIDAQMSEVNAHLAEMGWPAVDPAVSERIKAVAAAVWG